MNVSKLGTILGVWAHPDDEAYLSGGLMAMAVNAGARVVCVTATRGELGTSEPAAWPPERLGALREAELRCSLGILGVTEHHWLGYADGGCQDAEPDEAIARLSELVDRIRPDTVVTFGPDGHTGHPDHRAVSAWVDTALYRGDLRGARLLHAAVTHEWAQTWSSFHRELSVFEDGLPATVDDDRLFVDLPLDDATLARKVRALAAQASQTTALISHLGPRPLRPVGRAGVLRVGRTRPQAAAMNRRHAPDVLAGVRARLPWLAAVARSASSSASARGMRASRPPPAGSRLRRSTAAAPRSPRSRCSTPAPPPYQ